MRSPGIQNRFVAGWNWFWLTGYYVWSKLRDEKVSLDPEMKDVLLTLLKPLKPMQVVGIGKIRVGESRDGGYVMLDDFAGIAAAYSFGIGSDVSWDEALAARGIPVFQFDHTIAGPPLPNDLFHFHPIRLGIEPGAGPLTDTLLHLVETNSAAGDDLLLKVDIEGDEWEVFAQVRPEILTTFRQIVCEFHGFHQISDSRWAARATRAFAHLTSHHQVIHLHRNSIMPWVVADGLEVPMVMEITFARKASYQFSETSEPFPGPLDKSSSRFFPDQPLDYLRQL
jgi:hypothetical protein